MHLPGALGAACVQKSAAPAGISCPAAVVGGRRGGESQTGEQPEQAEPRTLDSRGEKEEAAESQTPGLRPPLARETRSAREGERSGLTPPELWGEEVRFPSADWKAERNGASFLSQRTRVPARDGGSGLLKIQRTGLGKAGRNGHRQYPSCGCV